MSRPMVLYPPNPVTALFSGGKDSFATALVLSQAGLLKECLMIDTGIGVPEWRTACIKMCTDRGWAYRVIPTPIRYEWLVWKYGFPGPGLHQQTMTYLKGRAIRQWKQLHKIMLGPRKWKFDTSHCLASGVRRGESDRRAMHTKPISSFEGVTIYAPLWEWDTSSVWEYVKDHGYERPPSYNKLQISGDCLCGAFAREDERQAIQVHYPAIHERLCQLECEVGQQWGPGSKACGRVHVKEGGEALICVECGDADSGLV